MILRLIPFLLLLLPSVGWSQDGIPCDADTGQLTRGNYKSLGCFNICDALAAADSSCLYDIGAVAGPVNVQTYSWDFSNTVGVPDLVIFEIEDINGNCGATPDVTIQTSPEADIAPAYDLDSTAVVLTVGGTDRIIVDFSTAPPDRYLIATVADDASCDDLDVRMHLLVRSMQ